MNSESRHPPTEGRPDRDLEQRVARQGALPGNSYVVVVRHEEFRRSRGGLVVATPQADVPPRGAARLQYILKRVALGPPLPSQAAEKERLGIFRALPTLSSDALSSVAYGPEAGLTVLAAAGVAALVFELPIAIAIAILMMLVVLSYRQVVITRQADGGSYAVARDYLGRWPAMVAAGALLVDYVLTVSVSLSAGSDALASAFPVLVPLRLPLTLLLIAVLCAGNLRGVREAGALFSSPTYAFIIAMLILIAVGLVVGLTGGGHHAFGHYPPVPNVTEALTPFLVLTAFASGCSSMTGIEAVSDSVSSFRDPPGDRAATTLLLLGGLLVLLFIGVTVLDLLFGIEPKPNGNPTVLAQIAAHVFTGHAYFFFYIIQFTTTMVLILGANASFNGFPRLAAFLARDDRLPHRFGAFGDRLVYSAAILVLTGVAALVVFAFDANTDHLINLYAVGVFTAFTLAQAALVRYQLMHRAQHWRRNVFVNGLGAAATLVVDVIVMVVKFRLGAWVVLVIVPLLVLLFWWVGRHYHAIRHLIQAATAHFQAVEPFRTVVPVWSLDPPTRRAIAYAARLGQEVVALNLTSDTAVGDELAALRLPGPDPAQLIEVGVVTPRRRPGLRRLLDLIDGLQREGNGRPMTVMVPDVVTGSGVLGLLRRPRSLRFKLALLRRAGVVTASYPAQGPEAAPKPVAELDAETTRARSEAADAGAGAPTSGSGRRRVALVPVAGLDVLALRALTYAQAISDEVIALHVATGQPLDVRAPDSEAPGGVKPDDTGMLPDEEARALKANWDSWVQEHLEAAKPYPQLWTLISPYRTVVQPVLVFLEKYRKLDPDGLFTVVLPELVTRHWWNQVLHNHRAFHIKAALLGHPDFAVADVPYALEGR